MGLDRNELARDFALALAKGYGFNSDVATRGVELADALLAALTPPAPVAPDARPTHVVWTASGLDTTTPRRVLRWDGDCPVVGLYNSRVGIDETRESSPIAPGDWSPATPPAPVEPARCEPNVDPLIEAVRWVLHDAMFKAPEQIGDVADRWVSRLQRGMEEAGLPVSS